MVEVIAKLQEAARKAEEAAARLESGVGANDAEGEADDAAEEDEAEEAADDSAPAEIDTAPEPSAAPEATSGEQLHHFLIRIDFVVNPCFGAVQFLVWIGAHSTTKVSSLKSHVA